MIDRMRDLAEVDEQLAALGKPPEDVRALLGRVLGEDRSRARLEQLLAELGAAAPLAPGAPAEPARPASARPAPTSERFFSAAPAQPPAPEAVAIATALANDTMVDSPALALSLPSVEESELDSDTAALLSGIEAKDAAPAVAPEAPPEAPPPERGGGTFASMFDLTDPPPARVSAHAPEIIPAAAKTPAQEREERRSSIKALLDQSLDPKDFPSTPPPPRVPAEAAIAAPSAEDEDGFEMLVDEEVIELVDDELEIMDDEDEGSA